MKLDFDYIIMGFLALLITGLITLAILESMKETSRKGIECKNLMTLATSWPDSALVYAARSDCLWRIK